MEHDSDNAQRFFPYLVSGKARLAAVLGDPVAHSRSPRLHGYWISRAGIDAAYIPLPVREGRLGVMLPMLAELGFAGCNLTIPHKEAALSVVNELDASARAIGAVNTIIFSEGRILGTNTDAEGFIEGLRAGLTAQNKTLDRFIKHAVVLGAGGAARAVVYGLLQAGVQKVTILNRSPARAIELQKDMHAVAASRLHTAPWEKMGDKLAEATLLVNATSLGMEGQPPLLLPSDKLVPGTLVTDIVYAPLKTALLTQARAKGCVTVDGLNMLIYQARASFAQWFGVTPEVDATVRTLLQGADA